MAQSFSTDVVSNAGPFYPITASSSGMAEGIIGVRHAEAAPAKAEPKPRPSLAPHYQDLPQQRAA